MHAFTKVCFTGALEGFASLVLTSYAGVCKTLRSKCNHRDRFVFVLLSKRLLRIVPSSPCFLYSSKNSSHAMQFSGRTGTSRSKYFETRGTIIIIANLFSFGFFYNLLC